MDNIFRKTAFKRSYILRIRRGQILVEVIIASLVIVGASLAIVQILYSSLRGVDSSISQSPAIFLAGETIEALRAVVKEDWHNVSSLGTSSVNLYYPTISGGKWTAAAGSENINLNNATYTRSFYLEDVYRSTSTGGIVSSGGYYDPSTIKITAKLTWNDSSESSREFTQVGYLSRFLNRTYAQTDWSGGEVGEGVTTVTTTTFATSSGIDFSGAVGSIKLIQQ